MLKIFRPFREHGSKLVCRRGDALETVGIDAAYGDILENFQSASAALSLHRTVSDIAAAALELALALTKSAVAFLAVYEDNGEGKRIFSRASETGGMRISEEEIERIFAAAAAYGGPIMAAKWAGLAGSAIPAIRSTCAQTLQAGGQNLGMIGVASPSGFSVMQQRTFTIFASQVAAALAAAQQYERRQEMVDTLVNLRADLDKSEKERLINLERVRSAERLERAHEAAVDALLAISRHARTGHGLSDFYRRLTRSIAELVAANKVLFWKLDEGGLLRPIGGAHGVADQLIARLYPAPCAPDRDDLASRVVFHDLMFRAGREGGSGDFQFVLDTLKVDDAIAVPWRAGDERLGLVAAYDSRRSEGFTPEDAWVLQNAGLAAGLVWQLKYAEADLKKTVDRLQRIDAARQLLLKNVSTAVDKARKRIAVDLHDDALQKLTAAELHLQRLQGSNGDGSHALSEARSLLAETEDALRRLLFEIRPPALELPGGFLETIRERIRILKTMTGAEVETELDLPDELSYEFRSMLFRQLTEALANIEKHAAATRIKISLGVDEGGIRCRVEDDGRGFVVAERDRLPGHLGLLALHERALLAGGWNKVESEPGLGTRVEFWLPIAEAKV